MKSATISLRGKTTTIKYEVIALQKLVYAKVFWESGKYDHFYQGMYGDKTRWENNAMPKDLILVLSDIFNKEEPRMIAESEIWKHRM